MIDVVSFDFFSPVEYFDVGMTETEAWSENFEWLRYESINFIEGMGSILLVAFFLAFCALAAMITHFLKCRIPCKSFRKTLKT